MPRISTTEDQIAAHRLAINSLPRASQWSTAVLRRGDGTSVSGVFAALDAVRMDWQARVGCLVAGDGAPMEEELLDRQVHATPQDALTALELAISRLPKRSVWQGAVSLREEGTTADGIFSAIGDIRADLHQRIGKLLDLSSTDGPSVQT